MVGQHVRWQTWSRFTYGMLLVVFAMVTSTSARGGESDSRTNESAIRTVLELQADAWNRGDIDAFMDHYWKSDQLTFSSEGKTTRGWNATKENYKRRYPTKERMGKVKFEQLEITSLSDAAALVLGKWSLQRESDPVGGNFSLVLRKYDGRWLIVHDHTSRGEVSKP